MSYHHFSKFERSRIEELSTLGYSNRAIAKRLNRHRSSIDRGLQRNTAGSSYKAEYAQDAYDTRRKKSKPKGKLSDHLTTIIADNSRNFTGAPTIHS